MDGSSQNGCAKLDSSDQYYLYEHVESFYLYEHIELILALINFSVPVASLPMPMPLMQRIQFCEVAT